LALIGIDKDWAAACRVALYDMAAPKRVPLVDLGDVRNTGSDFLYQLSKALLGEQMIPVLIGGQSAHIDRLYKVMTLQNEGLNLVFSDESIRGLEPSLSDMILQETPRRLQHVSVLGWQRPYSAPMLVDQFANAGFDLYPLGTILNNRDVIEPSVRDTDLFCFHLSVLQQQLVGLGVAKASPTGMSLVEAAQIAHFVGCSHRLKGVVLSGLPEFDSNNLQPAATLAFLIWSLLEGKNKHVFEYPTVAGTQWQCYIVQSDNDALSFWRSGLTDRWWLELQLPGTKRRFMPCQFSDYESAGQGEMPDRLFKALQRAQSS
jgi:hypothetical protein